MKSNMKKKMSLGVTTLSLATTLFLCSFGLIQDSPWVAPESAKKMKNPVATDAESIAAGKSLYTTACKSCHGVKGKGDGPKAVTLDKEPGDFSSEKFQSETDGEIYWKTTEGKDPMPSFKSKLTEEKRWQVVNYIRTLAVKK